MTRRWEVIAESLEDTDALGAALARHLPPGTTVALNGTLGAGKTRLVQAIAAGLGVPRGTVVSPTFVLCQEYYGTKTLYHLDAYRLDSDEQFRDLGPEEYFQSDGLTLIEWAERVAGSLPAERVDIEIEILDGDRRKFVLRAPSSRLEQALAKVAA